MADEVETSSAVDPSGLLLLCKADTETAERFLHQSISHICKQRGPGFKDFSSIWSIRDWISLTDNWNSAIKVWIGNNVGKEEIKEQLKNQGFSDEWISRILICIALRKQDVKQSLSSQTSCIAQSSLTNFDWNVKLVMSSDKLANIREPLSEIHFELKNKEGQEHVSLELNKEELKMLIDKMEAANKAMMQFRS